MRGSVKSQGQLIVGSKLEEETMGNIVIFNDDPGSEVCKLIVSSFVSLPQVFPRPESVGACRYAYTIVSVSACIV